MKQFMLIACLLVLAESLTSAQAEEQLTPNLLKANFGPGCSEFSMTEMNRSLIVIEKLILNKVASSEDEGEANFLNGIILAARDATIQCEEIKENGVARDQREIIISAKKLRALNLRYEDVRRGQMPESFYTEYRSQFVGLMLHELIHLSDFRFGYKGKRWRRSDRAQTMECSTEERTVRIISAAENSAEVMVFLSKLKVRSLAFLNMVNDYQSPEYCPGREVSLQDTPIKLGR